MQVDSAPASFVFADGNPFDGSTPYEGTLVVGPLRFCSQSAPSSCFVLEDLGPAGYGDVDGWDIGFDGWEPISYSFTLVSPVPSFPYEADR